MLVSWRYGCTGDVVLAVVQPLGEALAKARAHRSELAWGAHPCLPRPRRYIFTSTSHRSLLHTTAMSTEEKDREFDDDEIEEEFNHAPEPSHPDTTQQPATTASLLELPELTRKDKTLQEMLELVDGDFAPIIPDAVTDYYLAKNGFQTTDVRIKRLLALATQKFISDIAQDAHEYSRIRSSSAVYNSSNPQLRAKQLLQGQQYANQQNAAAGASEGGDQQQPLSHATNAGNQQGKIVLTMEDLSSALSEYGVNTARPDFYR